MLSLQAMAELETLLVVDCCECQKRLTAAVHRAQYAEETREGTLGPDVPELCGPRLKDRPCCRRCFDAVMNYEPGRAGRRRFHRNRLGADVGADD